MEYSVYINGSYSFFNGVDKAADLFHTYMFKPDVKWSDFSEEDIIEKIKLSGGYLVRKDGTQYSSGNYYSCGDYYIHKSFSAVVYNYSKFDQLIISTEVTSAKGLVLPGDLDPTHYLATDAQRALGKPFLRYAGVGSSIFATIDVDYISGISADYYALNSYELEGCFGVHANRTPMFYYPLNEKSAKALNSLLFQNVKNRPALAKFGTCPLEYTHPDLREDGVLFTSATKTAAALTRNQIARGVALTNTSFAKVYKRPVWSNEEFSGLFQFASPSKPEDVTTIDAVVFTGPTNVAVLNTQVADVINQNGIMLESPHGYLVDNEINRVFMEADAIYEKKRNEYWKAKVDEVRDASVTFLNTAAGKIGYILNSELQQQIFSRIQPMLNLFKDSKNVVLRNGLSLDVKVGDLPQIAGDSTKDYQDFVKSCYDLYGADATVDNPVINFGATTTDNLRRSISESLVGVIAGQVNTALERTFEHFTKGTLRILDNTCKNKYWCFGTKTQKHAIFPKQVFSNIASLMQIQDIRLETINKSAGTGRIVIVAEAAFVDRVWFGAKNYDYAKVFKQALDAFLPGDLAVNFLGYGRELLSSSFHFPKFSNVKGFLGIPKLRFNYPGSYKDWTGAKTMRFEVSKYFDYNTAFTPVYNFKSSDPVMNLFNEKGNSLAAIEMLKYLSSHLEELKQAAKMNPLVLAQNHFVSPSVGKMFFNCPLLFTSENLEAVIIKAAKAGYSDEHLAEVIDALADVRASLGVDSVNPVHWLTETSVLGAQGVEFPNLIPFYCFYGV